MLTNFLGHTHEKKQALQIGLLVLLAIILTNGISYVGWGATRYLKSVVCLMLGLSYLMMPKGNKNKHFSLTVSLLMFLPLLSMINTWYYYSQSPISSLYVLSGSFVWSVYFLLHRFKVKESVVLRTFLVMAILIVLIQIIQQFTFPHAYFGVDNDTAALTHGREEIAEMRNGLWRFRLSGCAFFTAPILFALWVWIKKKLDMQGAIFFFLFLVSIYLTLTRQVMAACVLAIICSYFIGGQKIQMKSVFLLLLLAFGLYYFYDLLFSELVERTADETEDDNIRVLSAYYFWNASLESISTFLLGMGRPCKGEYEKLMNVLNESYGFYPSDVGFIGKIYESGILYILLCYGLLFKLFFLLSKKIPYYVRMFCVFTGVMSVMIFPFLTESEFLIWSMLLYVCDLHINKSPLCMETTKFLYYKKSKI